MATQGGFVQGLLQSLQPWMTGGSPSALDNSFAQYGGTQGLLDAMLQASPGSQGAAAFGRAMQGAQGDALINAGARQSLAQQGLGLQMKGAMLPMQLAMMRRYYGGMLGQNGQPQPASSPQGAPAQAVPQQTADTSQQAPNPFSVPTPSQIGSIPIGGLPPGYGSMWAFMNNKDPVAAAAAEHAAQVKLAQEQYGPALAQLDTLGKAQSPTQYVSANPQLKAEWQQLAPSLGFDPAKGFTDPNVRTAFSFLRNRMAGALGEGTVAPPVQMSQTAGPLGSIFQRNPITNAVSQVKAEEQLKPVVAPDGTVRYAPASQAAGQTPFNDQTYVNPQSTSNVAKLIANYEMPPLSGYSLRSAQGQAIMAAVKQINPQYDATQYTTKNTARMKFAVGKQGDIVRSLSVATNHLDQLSEAAHALDNNQIPVLNKIANGIGVHVGNDPVTNFNAMKEIVGDEVVKAVVGSSGAEGDREAIKEAFNAARSPQQLEGVIQKYEGLMGGQLSGLRRQYQRSTGLNDFDSFVSTLAQQKLSNADTAGTGGTPQPLNVGQSTTVGQFTVRRVK